jgi:uncharacterized protein (TIGR02757 family)
MIQPKNLKKFLDEQVVHYHRSSFVPDDPISIPKKFKQKQDIEIVAFLLATIAWGNRKSIISSGERLVDLMGAKPYDFILNHSPGDLKGFENFVHRTFQSTDILYFIHRLKRQYQEFDSLETMFSAGLKPEDQHTGPALVYFHQQFFDDEFAPNRTRKHVATPERKSACKRLNMFLRWMVRPAEMGVDFGLWKDIKTSQLLLPLDVHVQRVALELGLLTRKQSDWKACLELWKNVRLFDSDDPCKYDFALFGIGVDQKI